MVVFTNEQVGTMVNEIYGKAVHSNFEDVECGPDPLHPSDDECSSNGNDEVDGVEDGVVYSSGDDAIKEVYADQAPPARARVQYDDIVEVIADPAPPATAQVQDRRCAAGEHCGMKTMQLALREGHVCLNCNKKLHGRLCGTLWDKRGDICQVSVEDLSEQRCKNTSVVGALICLGCI